MAQAKDIALKEQDLIIKDGDFVADLSDEQHVEHLLISHHGNWKRSPLAGVGIHNQLNSPSPKTALRQSVQKQLEADGYANVEVEIPDFDNIRINAERR